MDRMLARLGSSPLGPILLGIVYFCCAELALALTRGVDGIATVWPPSGVLLATLLIVPRRTVWRYVVGAAVGSWLANYSAGSSVLLSTGLTSANLLEALVGMVLLRRRAGCRVSFVDPAGLGWFAAATLAAAAASAALAFLVYPPADRHFVVSWFTTVWLGMLLVTPALMVLYEAAASVRRGTRVAEPARLSMIFAAAAVTCAITFWQSLYPILFLPMMVATAAVLGGGALGGIIVIGVTAVVGSSALAYEHGPLSLIKASDETRVLFFQIYLVMMFISALPMAKFLTGRERLRIDLAERIRLLDQAERSGHIGHWRLSPYSKTVYWSPEVFRIHGLTHTAPPLLTEAIDFYHPDDRSMVTDLVERALSDGQPFDFAARIVHSDGTIRHVISRGERDYASTDEAIGLFGIVHDVTEQVYARERIAEARDRAECSARDALVLANTDPLTGLPNRRSIIRHITNALETATHEGKTLSIVMFDIDHFKAVNDGFGHDVGDTVLKQVAATAAEALRAKDLIGRYGGEEFVLLLTDTTTSGALQSAERVRAMVEAVAVDGLPRVTISLGIATFADAETVDSILRRADVALYAAKAAGRNQLRVAA